MLVSDTIANDFLTSYKAVLTEINGGKLPRNIDEYTRCRDLLYSNSVTIAKCASVTEDFKESLGKSVCGQFIYLKKYKKWYAFQHIETSRYFAVLGLTSPIEEMVEEFSIIETALVPYRGLIVCDGLIVNRNTLLGKNMIKNCRDGYFQTKKSGDLIREM